MASSMASDSLAQATGQAIVNFQASNSFPESDEISTSYLSSTALSAALSTVQTARHDLEEEIKYISRESALEVDEWVKNARILQYDIEQTKVFSARIAQEAGKGDELWRREKEDSDYTDFLSKEIAYSDGLLEALRGIKVVKEMLDSAEAAAHDFRILEALNILAGAWDYIGEVPANELTRPMRVLSERSFELKAGIHDTFDSAWGKLVCVDKERGAVTVSQVVEGGTDMERAMTVIKAYKEEQHRLQELYEDLDELIIKPRVLLTHGILRTIVVEGNTIHSSTEPASLLIKDLFADLEKVVLFISTNFPPDWARDLSVILMPKLTTLINETWLESAVPTNLEDMTNFRKTIAIVQAFAESVSNLSWEGDYELNEWVESAPRLWVAKRRERDLDLVRRKMALGIGQTREVERTETQIITEEEVEQINQNGAPDELDDHGWDAAWSDHGDEQPEDELVLPKTQTSGTTSCAISQTRSTLDLPAKAAEAKPAEPEPVDDPDNDADAWGWGDEDLEDLEDAPVVDQKLNPLQTQPQSTFPNLASPNSTSPPAQSISPHSEEPPASQPRTSQNEVTLTEQYTISSLPDPVFRTIADIIEDGVTLTQEMHSDNPVTAAAVGLFGLPTLVLAMYRAASPYYYSRASGGNMYAYNDAMYLSEQLRSFGEEYLLREDLGPRAKGKVRLEGEIKALESFGRRAYGNEMSTQRTVVMDLLGGAQNFISEGEPQDNEVAIESVVGHIRQLSTEWKGILSRSAWAQAIGALLSTMAKKLIVDVEDLTSLGADEAYRVAGLIGMVTKMDDLFMPERSESTDGKDGEEGELVPMTSQYAPNWLKLNFLSEVLQSDLKDLQYLWFESDLSVYFTADEVVDLIVLSFESNYRTKDAIRKIREAPTPRGVLAEKMI